MPYIEYFSVKKDVSLLIKNFAQTHGINEIWCQNIWAPMASEANCSIKSLPKG